VLRARQSQSSALRRWAEECGKIISPSFIEEKLSRGDIAFRAEEFEHIVYHDPNSDRAIKLTRLGTFGWIRGILEYFDRLDFCNHIFGDLCQSTLFSKNRTLNREKLLESNSGFKDRRHPSASIFGRSREKVCATSSRLALLVCLALFLERLV
jgi:hypothetical protein